MEDNLRIRDNSSSYRPFLKFYFSSVFVMVFCDNCLSLTAKESDNLL